MKKVGFMTKSARVFHTVIRVPKQESAFLYFQLEANEGLCFYSTLQESLGQGHRDIEVTADISLEEEVKRLLEYLSKTIPMEFLC